MAVAGKDAKAYVRATGGSGWGSTNTHIREFSSTLSSSGTAITAAHSSTLGSTFTINEDGIYAIEYTDGISTGDTSVGISLNSSQLTTNIHSITEADRLQSWEIDSAFVTGGSRTVRLSAGDVVRAHGAAYASMRTSAHQVTFNITQVSI